MQRLQRRVPQLQIKHDDAIAEMKTRMDEWTRSYDTALDNRTVKIEATFQKLHNQHKSDLETQLANLTSLCVDAEAALNRQPSAMNNHIANLNSLYTKTEVTFAGMQTRIDTASSRLTNVEDLAGRSSAGSGFGAGGGGYGRDAGLSDPKDATEPEKFDGTLVKLKTFTEQVLDYCDTHKMPGFDAILKDLCAKHNDAALTPAYESDYMGCRIRGATYQRQRDELYNQLNKNVHDGKDEQNCHQPGIPLRQGIRILEGPQCGN